ncbi:hypothetical protein LXL04_025189 [Taraxacum kok-saghyz]
MLLLIGGTIDVMLLPARCAEHFHTDKSYSFQLPATSFQLPATSFQLSASFAEHTLRRGIESFDDPLANLYRSSTPPPELKSQEEDTKKKEDKRDTMRGKGRKTKRERDTEKVHGVHVNEPETTWKPLNPSSCGVASMLSPSSMNPSISIFLLHLSLSSGPRPLVPFLLLPFSLFRCEPVLSLEPELADPESGHRAPL